MNNATAGEAHELRMKSFECLGQIFAQAVSFVGILWHERNHIGIDNTLIEHEQLQRSLLTVGIRSKHTLVFLPRLVGHALNRCLGQQLRVFVVSLWLNEHNAHSLVAPLYIAKERREVIFCAGLQRQAIEAIVLNTESFPALVIIILLHTLDMKAHVGRVVRMNGVVHARLHIAQRMSGTNHAPGSTGSPAITL